MKIIVAVLGAFVAMSSINAQSELRTENLGDCNIEKPTDTELDALEVLIEQRCPD
jgi:hypothetical protein